VEVVGDGAAQSTARLPGRAVSVGLPALDAPQRAIWSWLAPASTSRPAATKWSPVSTRAVHAPSRRLSRRGGHHCRLQGRAARPPPGRSAHAPTPVGSRCQTAGRIRMRSGSGFRRPVGTSVHLVKIVPVRDTACRCPRGRERPQSGPVIDLSPPGREPADQLSAWELRRHKPRIRTISTNPNHLGHAWHTG
jgi:hypothetical protein